MADSHGGSKPGSRTGAPSLPAAPKPAAARPDPGRVAPEKPAAPAGRIVHDERGNAVWDWLKDTARMAIDSTSRLLRRLEVPELQVEDTQEKELRLESDRDAGGGYDPYGGGTSSPKNGRPAGGGRAGDSRSPSSSAARSGRSSPDSGGGYDPYGKGVTRKPGR
jgi:hypothetical protein